MNRMLVTAGAVVVVVVVLGGGILIARHFIAHESPRQQANAGSETDGSDLPRVTPSSAGIAPRSSESTDGGDSSPADRSAAQPLPDQHPAGVAATPPRNLEWPFPSASTLRPVRRPTDPADGPLEPAIPEPVARAALGAVGVDPVADAVWMQAINDPALSADERQNLIEDLNEDSFPDPKHITPDDLPLIVSRMQMIEEIAPQAIDDVNAAAFEEAYKDLNALLLKVTR